VGVGLGIMFIKKATKLTVSKKLLPADKLLAAHNLLMSKVLCSYKECIGEFGEKNPRCRKSAKKEET
jgi:hypothetical protein